MASSSQTAATKDLVEVIAAAGVVILFRCVVMVINNSWESVILNDSQGEVAPVHLNA